MQRRRQTHPRKFKHLGGKVLQHGSDVNSCLGANAHLVLSVLLQEALDTAAGELECDRLATVRDSEQLGTRPTQRPGAGLLGHLVPPGTSRLPQSTCCVLTGPLLEGRTLVGILVPW